MNSEQFSTELRRSCLKLCHARNASHIGGAFSIADVVAVLFTEIIRVYPEAPKHSDRDRIFYSKGHSCTVMYAALELLGFYDNLIDRFAVDGSVFTSHVNHKVPGIELSTGSLGHALSVSAGVAIAAKRKSANWKIFTILSDGELDEGSNWETILFAPHHRLDNLVVIVDYNKIQSMGATKDVLDLDPLADKFRAFKWEVSEINGHDHSAIRDVLRKASAAKSGTPHAIIAHTIKGKGVSFMENSLLWHYRSPNKDQLEAALKELELAP